MKRAAVLLLGGTLALASLVLLPTPAHANIQTAGRLTLTSASVVQGGVVTAKGWLPPRAARTVLLQRRTSWGWSALDRSKTTDRGRFSFTYSADIAPGRILVRVFAPRRKIDGKVFHMVKTPRRYLVVKAEPQVPGDIARVTSGSNRSDRATLSADGRFVLFDSLAPDLVSGDTNDYQDVFVHDRDTGTTTAITNGRGTSYAGAISGDGRYVVFDSYASSLVPDDTNQSRDVFVYDRETDVTTRITDGNDGSYASGVSADGRFVVYYSYASDLAPDDTNGYRDVFVYDRELLTTTKVTGGNGAALAPAISADGRWVSFYSGASNLVPGDRNHTRDVFLYDRETATTTRITNGNGASYSSPLALSGDGRYVAFYSLASDLVDGDTNERSDIFVYDQATATTTQLTRGNNHSADPSFSTDGQHVAFESFASDLARGDVNDHNDVFVYDVATGMTTRLTNGGGPSYGAASSADGGFIAFTSLAGDLTPGDTNNMDDIFVWTRTG